MTNLKPEDKAFFFPGDREFLPVCLQAADECSHPREEEGGIIFRRGTEYSFSKITNKHTGTSQAEALYEADKVEMGRETFKRINEGWQLFASFHTHPLYSSRPSQLDLDTLFLGFKYNVIYALQSPPLTEPTFSLSTWHNGEIYTQHITKRLLAYHNTVQTKPLHYSVTNTYAGNT